MIKQLLSLSLFGILSLSLYSQNEDLLKVSTIPLALREHANAVVRYDDMDINIIAYDKMVLTNKRIVTVVNKEGDSDLGAVFHYDDKTNVKKLEVKIHDENGNEIKKIKKNDFRDVSAVDGSTLYSDSRVKYLDYTPIAYPYTMVLEAEVEHNSTAFIPGWRPIEGFYVSTENADYNIINSSGEEVKVKISNFDNYGIQKNSDFHFTAKNLKAIQPEAYSPSFSDYAPSLRVALTRFDMEGVEGSNKDWIDFGQWANEKLLKGTDELPESVKNEIKNLTEGVSDKYEKAKIVYNYVQNKTRYISVQVGIGGWKPYNAEDVDRLGYGDCKGLSNYTKTLLREVGVESYMVFLFGGRNITDIEADFSSARANHAILCIPDNDENIWLECTSQTSPFGFIAGFTDDRDVLLVTPEGGKIAHTKSYSKEESLQFTKANIKLNADGSMSAEVMIRTQGFQYAMHDGILQLPAREQELQLKEYWDYINNLSIESMDFINDKDSIIFTEKVKLSALNYATKSGNRILFQPNAFNKVTSTPARYKNRSLDFEIDRGFTDEDEFTIEFDSSLEIEAVPNDVSIETKFGNYSYSITKLSQNQLLYKRTFSMNKGYYPKEEYEEFRTFRLNVAKHDKTKIVLVNKT